MSRVLMIGYGPLPAPGLAVYASPGLRTRQLFAAARAAGAEVSLYALPLPGSESAEGDEPALLPETHEGAPYVRLSTHSGDFASRVLRERIAEFRPDAIVGVGTYPSYVAAMLPTTAPLWCDFGRCWMAERQTQAYGDDDDRALMTAWNIERTALRRLDRFSACSRPHLYGMLGGLGAAGRLNKRTFGYLFGTRLPHAAFRWPDARKDPSLPVLRGPVVPEDAFVLLWHGSFDDARDAETAAAAAESLMARRPEVRFVATGGAARGSEARAYRRFLARVEESPHRDRFHALGWVASEKLGAICREADLGINADGVNYDGIARGGCRLISMAAEGLAAVSTVVSETSEWLEDSEALVGVPPGDPAAMAAAIEPFVEDRRKAKELGVRARRVADADFSDEETTRAFRDWIAEPRPAPDNAEKARIAGTPDANLLQIALNPIEEWLLQQDTARSAAPAPPQSRSAAPPEIPWWETFADKLLGGGRRGRG